MHFHINEADEPIVLTLNSNAMFYKPWWVDSLTLSPLPTQNKNGGSVQFQLEYACCTFLLHGSAIMLAVFAVSEKRQLCRSVTLK